jgi:hypothetical protein
MTHIEPMRQALGLAGRVVLVGLVVAGVIVTATSPIGPSGLGFVPYGAVGALLVIRRPGTSIGWILLGLGLCYALLSIPVEATAQSFADGTVGLPVALFAIVHGGLGTTAFFLYAVLAVVFPSGRLPTGRWGRLGRAGLGVGLVLTVAAYVSPVVSVGYPTSAWVRNPIAVFPDLPIWQVVNLTTVIFPVLVLVIAGAVSLVVRVRRARGTERQQLRWIAASIVVVLLAVFSGFVIGSLVPGSYDNGLAWLPAIMAVPTVPVAIGIAVLRYRLYEIDRIISRTIAYGVLTAVVGSLFVGFILVFQAVLAPVTRSNELAVAGSTLLVAALFQPLRRRLQRLVDRRFNRIRYDADQTVAAFASRLRDEVDLEQLRAEILANVAHTVEPSSASLWLRE